MAQPGYAPNVGTGVDVAASSTRANPTGWGSQLPGQLPAAPVVTPATNVPQSTRSAIPIYQNVTLGVTPGNPGTGLNNPFIQPVGWSATAGFSYSTPAPISYATTSTPPYVTQVPAPTVTQAPAGSVFMAPASVAPPLTSVPAMTTSATTSYQQGTAGQTAYWSQPQPHGNPALATSLPPPVTAQSAPVATTDHPATVLSSQPLLRSPVNFLVNIL
ncbi:hypothetical protein P3T76_006884 [Phytophthora citrophthora]|uniref:Uncharacterized protein n=1 Tax=Phytophthora citrophthora TaxID=4793 RepID=A0AAD9GNR6_9STRA|nr:hypothetical protein P3T76_006884 [Phytophthora citrophthora]